MTLEQRQKKIDYLWQLQESTRTTVQDIADRMAKIVTDKKLILSQSGWNKLFREWEAAHKKMQDIGKRLRELHGL